jgi:hypothetical protein
MPKGERKHVVIILGGFPSRNQTMALVAGIRETGSCVIRISSTLIITGMTGITGG